jgi:hypothetical protein
MALHDGPNSLWREAVKEIKGILETRLGLVKAADRK